MDNIVGNTNQDLILQTLGKVFIKQGRNSFELTRLLENINKTQINKTLVIESASELPTMDYPGDGYFVFCRIGEYLYFTDNGQYINLLSGGSGTITGDYIKKSGDTMTGTLELDGEVPLIVNSSRLVHNLNAEYLSGLQLKYLAIKNSDEDIKGKWSFKSDIQTNGNNKHSGINTFNNVTVFNNSIKSEGFKEGYNGFGFCLDSNTNTLTIDNLIVRKILQVYELVVNKIRATNGSLWVTDGAKITEANKLTWLSGQKVSSFTISDSGLVTDSTTTLTDQELALLTQDAESITDPNFVYYYAKNLEYAGVTRQSLNMQTLIQGVANYYTKNTDNTFTHNKEVIISKYFTGDYFLIVLDEENVKFCPFVSGDIIRCQQQSFTTGISTAYYDAIVTDVLDGCLIVRLSGESNTDPNINDSIVRIGNILDNGRQGSVFLTSNEANSPYIEIMDGVNTPDYNLPIYDMVNGEIVEVLKTKVRVGKLDGIKDPHFPTDKQPTGYGIYGQNAYFVGEFYLSNGQSVVQVSKEEILIALDGSGLSIRNEEVTLNGEKIKIKVGDVEVALFTVVDGKATINAEFIKVDEIEAKKVRTAPVNQARIEIGTSENSKMELIDATNSVKLRITDQAYNSANEFIGAQPEENGAIMGLAQLNVSETITATTNRFNSYDSMGEAIYRGEARYVATDTDYGESFTVKENQVAIIPPINYLRSTEPRVNYSFEGSFLMRPYTQAISFVTLKIYRQDDINSVKVLVNTPYRYELKVLNKETKLIDGFVFTTPGIYSSEMVFETITSVIGDSYTRVATVTLHTNAETTNLSIRNSSPITITTLTELTEIFKNGFGSKYSTNKYFFVCNAANEALLQVQDGSTSFKVNTKGVSVDGGNVGSTRYLIRFIQTERNYSVYNMNLQEVKRKAGTEVYNNDRFTFSDGTYVKYVTGGGGTPHQVTRKFQIYDSKLFPHVKDLVMTVHCYDEGRNVASSTSYPKLTTGSDGSECIEFVAMFNGADATPTKVNFDVTIGLLPMAFTERSF